MAHHWEARFRQRQVDKMQAAKLRMAEKEAEEERVRCEVAARQALEQQEEQDARSAALQKQIQTRDKSGIKKSYKEREQQLQRLLQEQKWHNEMIRKMEKEERRSLRTDALRDHNSKSKVLRDHGLYRGDASFFLDPEYAWASPVGLFIFSLTALFMLAEIEPFNAADIWWRLGKRLSVGLAKQQKQNETSILYFEERVLGRVCSQVLLFMFRGCLYAETTGIKLVSLI